MDVKKIVVVVELITAVDKNKFSNIIKATTEWKDLEISCTDTSFPLVLVSGQQDTIDDFKDRAKKEFPDFVLKVEKLMFRGF